MMVQPPVVDLRVMSAVPRLHLLQSVVESAPDGVLLAVVSPHPDVPLQIIYGNVAFSTMTGYTSEEIVGASLAFLSGPDTDPAAMAQMLAAAGDNTPAHFEMQVYRKDRTPLWVALGVVPATDPETDTRYVAIFQRDITSQKSQQAAVRAINAGLRRSNRALQEFASVASHDLQEPLRKIKAFGDFLVEHSGADLDEEGRDALARMLNAAGRMQVLINDLLTFARLTTRSQPRVPVDLAQVVRGVLADLEAQIARTGGRVIVGDLATIDADPSQMRMLFQNLLSNALKFARPNVSPLITMSGRVILLSPSRHTSEGDAPLYEVTITDNGIGFDPQFAEKIFAIFQRLHRRTEYEGTGIGLAICREIVTYHGGTVTAIGIPGEGATFVVRLPLRHYPEELV